MKDKIIATGCYNRLDIWKDKKDALTFYKECASFSDGSEKERYTNIILDLMEENSKYGIDDSLDNDIHQYKISEISIHTENPELFKEKPELIELPEDIRYQASMFDGLCMYFKSKESSWEEAFDFERRILFERNKTPDEILDMKLVDDGSNLRGGLAFDGETVKDFLEDIYLPSSISMEEFNKQLIYSGIKPIDKEEYENFVNSKEKEVEL